MSLNCQEETVSLAKKGVFASFSSILLSIFQKIIKSWAN